ncbi:MAG: phosphotransferase family protein [Chloroflexia bacterium]
MSNSTPSNIKPLITPEMALPALQQYFDRPILDLTVVQGGQVAQTFSFAVAPSPGAPRSETRHYIARFNATMLVNFEKEAYAYEHFASPTIPIPRVVHLGRLGDVHFAIAEKSPGKSLLEIARSDYLALIPKLIDLLDAIHQLPIGDHPGYGIFGGNGEAFWPTWRAHLAFVREEEPKGDFYEGWHSLFQTSFLERDLFDTLYARMTQFLDSCPEDRYMVHGGYGFGNVLVDNGRITAVLDWMDARYGDFLYDVAWLDFWSPDDAWHDRFQQHYQHTGKPVHSYDERILCYQCYMALETFKFSAKAGDKSLYDFAKARIHSLLQSR